MREWLRYALLLAVFALLPLQADAQTAYTATPATLRAVAAKVLAAGKEAVVTCAPGDYPTWLRKDPGYSSFRAPVTFKCAGSTFIGGPLSGASNLTWDGGTFTGRVIVSDFSNAVFRNMQFPAGGGIQGRRGKGLLIEDNLIAGSGAPIAAGDVVGLTIRRNWVVDYTGDAGIGVGGGDNILIEENVVLGWRPAKPGVHNDAIQTLDGPMGAIVIRKNLIAYLGQGIFSGATALKFTATDNIVGTDAINALTYKSSEPAVVTGNVIHRLPSFRDNSPRIFNYGVLVGLPAATPGGMNSINGKAVEAR